MNPFFEIQPIVEDIVKRFLLIGCLATALASTQAWADLNSGLGAMERSDYATALKELAPLAERGNAEAQSNLGRMYLYGWGVRKSAAESAKWYRKAAEQGDAKAQKMLAYLLEQGAGVEKNPAEAGKWRRASEQPRRGAPTQDEAGAGSPSVAPDRPTAKSPKARSSQPKQTANINPDPGGNGNPTTMLTADARGHFITMGNVNGASVRMMVDTGATAVSMSAEEAWRIGLSYLNGERVRLSTANGIVTGYRVMLDTVEVGNITLNQVEGVVQESSIGVSGMPFVLLGMSFLNRVEMKREGTALTLTKK